MLMIVNVPVRLSTIKMCLDTLTGVKRNSINIIYGLL